MENLQNELKQLFHQETGKFWKGYVDTESFVNPDYVEWLEKMLIKMQYKV